MRRALPLLLVLSVFTLSSCGVRIYQPKKPVLLNPNAEHVSYTPVHYEADFKAYQAHLVKKEYDEARLVRNRIINRVMEAVDHNYYRYEAQFAGGRALFETVADAVGMGLTAAATVLGGQEIKTILSATATGTQGTRISITKNYLREKTTEVLLTAMRATRREKANLILEKMAKLSVVDYTLEEARVDLTSYFYAGSLQDALLVVTAETGAKEKTAVEKEKDITERRLAAATPQDVQNVEQVRTRFNELKAVNNVAEARAILGRLNVTIPDAATDAQIFDLLDGEIRKTIFDASLRPALFKAFGLN